MKQLLLIIGFFTLSFCGLSQSTIVQGVVKDSISNETIPFVKVRYLEGSAGALTDTSGFFFVQTTKPTDSLEFSFVGYKPQRFAVTAGITNEINVLLVPAIRSFDVVEIIAGENPAFEIIRLIKKNKKKNNPENLASYECEVYNKMQFDVNKLGSKFEDPSLLTSNCILL